MMATRNFQQASDGALAEPSVTVTCTARLHLGFLDLAGTLSRQFGSFGMSLDQPSTILDIARADTDSVSGGEPRRAAGYLARMVSHLGLRTPHRLTIHEAVQAHAGLGSGTQLALAIAAGVRQLHGFPPDLLGDAARLGRGARSGIGIGLFAEGGFVVDGGKGRGDAPPPLLARLEFPEAWRVILVLDRSREGLSGIVERSAFAGLDPMPDALSGEVCRLLLMRGLPGLVEQDIEAFGDAVTRIQQIVGDYFAPAQGGRFTSPAVASALSWLESEGAVGIGQSSWGPTGFAFVRDETEARAIIDGVTSALHGKGLDFELCRGLNRGATVTRSRGHA